MKICLVLMGPLAGLDRNYNEGEEITLEGDTANQLAGWGFVEILREAGDDSTAAGESAPVEPEPTSKLAPTTRRKAAASTEAET